MAIDFKKTLSSVVFIVILYCIYLLILLSLPYIEFKKNVDFLTTKQLIYHLDWWRWSFYIHVFSSPIVILAGLLQFNRYIIHRKKKLHRILGIIYILFVVLISGPSALLMGLYANGGYLAQISFVTLSCIWILSAVYAYVLAGKHSYLRHSRWMLRSYALTLSAITLRLYAYLFDYFNFSLGPKETYILLSYISWIPNLIIVELIIRTKFLNNLLKPY